jgi:hypothetical protein
MNMNALQDQFAARRTTGRVTGRASGPRRLKEAVLASFQASANDVAEEFQKYSENDWRKILIWLDVSGMALYLLDQIMTLKIESSLPSAILDRLQLNLAQNRQRTRTLLREAIEVAQRFQQAHITFALMKGITLPADAVPDPALRWQADLDFLIDESDADAASRIMRDLSYTLRATSERTMEFRSGTMSTTGLENFYREQSQRSIELHTMKRREGSPGQLARAQDQPARTQDLLARAQVRWFDGVAIPTLSSADILVQQAQHLLKHLCGEHTRLSWVLEFWRHLRKRQHDRAFWSEVRALAASEPQGELALSISVWLATEIFGPIAPGVTEDWMPVRIQNGVQFWLRRYARELLLSDSFGSKLYILLRRQLPNKPDLKGTARLMIPLCLPARLALPVPGETPADRMTRYRIDASYGWQRLRFHLFEGVRYTIEALCWEWRMSKVQEQ